MLYFKAVMTMSSVWGQRKIVPKQSFREDIGSPQGIETKCLFCVQWGGDVLVSTHVCAIACGLMCTHMWRSEVNSRSCPLKIGISYTGTWSSTIRCRDLSVSTSMGLLERASIPGFSCGVRRRDLGLMLV